MRERAAALGGSIEAGPRPDGGFRVLAALPIDVRITEDDKSRECAEDVKEEDR